MKKKINIFVIFMMILVIMPISISAEDVNAKKSAFLENDEIWHSLDELDTLDISETYSYEEIEKLFIDNGFNEAEIKRMVGEKPSLRASNTIVRYNLFKMDAYTYTSGISTYKLQPRITVGLEYYDSSTASPTRIVSLKGAHIYTGLAGKCVFSGTMIYELVAGNEFYYSFYGDIYKAGNISWSLGAEIGIGESASIKGEISSGDGFIKNVSEAGTYHSSGLQP